MCSTARCGQWPNFYPRPPRGGRHFMALYYNHDDKFLSTPSARRATAHLFWIRNLSSYFYPRPPRGGRRAHFDHHLRLDLNFYPRPPRGGRHIRDSGRIYNIKFLSTPSARRATRSAVQVRRYCQISINALREEGDRMTQLCTQTHHIFLSTPSARRATPCAARTRSRLSNFYPRPPRGGRPCC